MSMAQILLCGGAIVTLSMGIRHGFGLWLQPITQEMGWTRESFSLAIAVQNLSWGILGIFVGMLADRIGAFKVLIGGAILYALGLAGMALSPDATVFLLTAGVLIGAAQAGTTYAVIYGVLGRQIPVARRSWAMGVAAAAGSFGQFFMVPVEGKLIAQFGWSNALLILALLALLIAALAFGLREPGFGGSSPVKREQTVGQALREAWTYPSFLLLMAGYFVCGFQVMFIGVHMPSYLKDFGMAPHVASYSLALVGLFNIFGTYLAGNLGQRLPKRYLLAGIYGLRSVATVAFLLAPLSPWTVYAFCAAMGFLWLSTVPLTNATIAQIFGVQHLSMLGGFVFFSHQIGSFLGVWLGGYLYDINGNYDMVWYLSIALGIFAAIVNLPVREAAIARRAPGAA
ncbi:MULTISPECIES: MFS transporter [Comamonas]|jgi:MFS family permease|uniref:MFS transporter n=1 Tax=Comamonas TaxID=283 RepID=UPI0028432EC5|nr:MULTISPECIES: MFS transporter [Comamonas]MDR3066449.1 MFS transporter [Comamonas sp.]MEB5965382.1 MFS transporter [Comamonas testosteroni]